MTKSMALLHVSLRIWQSQNALWLMTSVEENPPKIEICLMTKIIHSLPKKITIQKVYEILHLDFFYILRKVRIWSENIPNFLLKLNEY